MKKLVRGLLVAWCALCGLIVPPAVLAVVLAQSMGMLDLTPFVERLQGPLEGDAEAGVTPAGYSAADEGTPLDAFSWRRRLEQFDAEVGRDAELLAEKERELDDRATRQARVGESLAGLLADLFGVPVTSEALLEEPDAWRRRLAERRSSEQRRPQLLKMIQSVDKEALALILSNPEESNGLDEDTVARLMEELPARRAGEVLTELGRVDPALASRILARLERFAGSAPSEEVSSP